MGSPEMTQMMDQMTSNPDMMKNMADMMGNMDPKMLEAIGAQTGMKIDPDMAKKMGEQMKGMDPESMKKMMAWGKTAQSAMVYKEKYCNSTVMSFLGGLLVMYLMVYVFGA